MSSSLCIHTRNVTNNGKLFINKVQTFISNISRYITTTKLVWSEIHSNLGCIMKVPSPFRTWKQSALAISLPGSECTEFRSTENFPTIQVFALFSTWSFTPMQYLGINLQTPELLYQQQVIWPPPSHNKWSYRPSYTVGCRKADSCSGEWCPFSTEILLLKYTMIKC